MTRQAVLHMYFLQHSKGIATAGAQEAQTPSLLLCAVEARGQAHHHSGQHITPAGGLPDT